MSDSSDDMELYSGFCDEDGLDEIDRIERLERLIVKIGNIALRGTGSLHRDIFKELRNIEKDLNEETRE